MAALFSVPIEEDHSKDFGSFDDLLEWLEKQRETWQWLWTEPRGEGSIPPNSFQNLDGIFQQGIILGRQERTGELERWITNAFGGKQIFAGESQIGREVFSALERFGPAEARSLFKTYSSGLESNMLRFPSDIRGMLLAVDPSLVDQLSFAEELQTERKKYRASITRLENKILKLEQVNRDDIARRSNQFRRAVALMRSLAQGKAQKIAEDFSLRTSEALGSITETEELYRNQMSLRAPVQYWKDKAGEHKAAEKGYRRLTIGFFAAAAFVIAVAAIVAGRIVLSVTEVEDRAPVYLLVAGALLGMTTLIFWAGRLIVKLWLSEHHLRKDATERSVMTETYLSLQEGGQASESEKAIVLAAIFRPTPDGVVKEEGPADLGLQAAISRYLAKP